MDELHLTATAAWRGGSADPAGALAGLMSGSELLEFALGVAVVGALFWLLYHLDGDWPERLRKDRGFREDAAAIAFAAVLAFSLVQFFY